MISEKTFVFPRKIPGNEYDKARSFFINTLKDFADVIGLYEFGKVSIPGLSDLDFAIVLRNKPKDIRIAEKIDKISFSDTAREIFCGSTIMVLCERHFPQITLWDDVDVSCLYGKELKLQSFSKETLHLLTVCQIMDWLPERFLSLLRAFREEPISAVNLIGYLYSLHFTFRKVEGLGILTNYNLSAYNNSIIKLRKKWFLMSELNQRSELAQLLNTVLEGGRVCLSSVENWLIAKGYYSFQKPDKLGEFYLTKNFGYTFTNQFSKIDWANITKETDNNCLLLPIPAIWACHLKIYASVKGAISNKLGDAFSHCPSKSTTINPKLLSILQRRITLCNEMAEFLYRHRFKKGLFKFGWFY